MAIENEIETQIREKLKDSENGQPELLQGKYEIVEQIGEGGMGKVYRGRDIYLKRAVAIKEFFISQHSGGKINKELQHELEVAFQREATLLANLKHEFLPVLFDFFTENYKHYLVMEFVEGDDLKKRAKELREKYDGQFPIEKVRKWAEDLLEVLIYLHDRESPIFHRDIKPENLKLRNDKICLLDFGLAKGSAGNISSSTNVDRTTYGFTARYAPVEQTRGEKTIAQTDLYALSATIYYLLTGVEPVDSRLREDAITSGIADPLRNVKILRPGIDKFFADIITKGLAVEASNRPESARYMLEALRTKEEKEDVPPAPLPKPLPLNDTIVFPPPGHIQVSVPPSPSPSLPIGKIILFSLIGIATLLIGASVIWLLIIPGFGPDSNKKPESNQIANVNTERNLSSEQKLYKRPRGKEITDTLSKGTKVKVDDIRQEPDGYWHYVKSGSKEGWIVCKSGNGEDCFASK